MNEKKVKAIKTILIESLRGGSSAEAAYNACKMSSRTYYEWYHKDKKFAAEVDKAQTSRIKIVEDALFKRACGYEYEEVCDSPDGTRTTTKHIAPDTTAQIFFLCNRSKDTWQNVNKVELAGKDGRPIIIKTINFSEKKENAKKP